MDKLGISQKMQLELTDLLHNICKEENLQYTLLGSSIAAWQNCGGFAPYLENISVGILYPSWLKFVDVCKKRLNGTDYYILDNHNCEQFDDLFVRLCKRSKVVLPEGRKKDEVYYDYFINVYPICYVGNTEKEFQRVKKKYMFYRKCARAERILSGTVQLNNFVKMAKRAYYYARKGQFTFEQMQGMVTEYGNEKTKYVLIPTMNKNEGVSCLEKTYLYLKEITFEGHTYNIIKDAEQWINGYYTKSEYEKLLSRPINKAVVEGPEVLRRIQLIELEMLKEFDRICRKHGLKYTLGFGTLIGAVRHGGFIPWDDDVDVCMLYEDYIKFIELAPTELNADKFFLRTQETDKDCNLSFIQIKRNNTVYCRNMRNLFDTHLGVFIDIFPYYNGCNSRILHRIQHKICRFYKTMLWAHMGAVEEKRRFYRQYYMLLSKVSNKTAYKRYMKWATIFKKPTDKLSFLSLLKNPYNKADTKRENLENIREIDFEGCKFFVSENYEDILKERYANYKSYPPVDSRKAKHLPAIIEIGDLYENLSFLQ